MAFILHFGFGVLLPSFNINIFCNKLYKSDSSQLWMLENVLFCRLCNCMRCLPVCCIWVAALYAENKSPHLFVAYFVLSPNKRCCQKGLNQLVPFCIRRIKWCVWSAHTFCMNSNCRYQEGAAVVLCDNLINRNRRGLPSLVCRPGGAERSQQHVHIFYFQKSSLSHIKWSLPLGINNLLNA